jgi:hypothetical protein
MSIYTGNMRYDGSTGRHKLVDTAPHDAEHEALKKKCEDLERRLAALESLLAEDHLAPLRHKVRRFEMGLVS